ncbi:MAG: hypothetical protein Q7S27_01300 [Nanoarchaeota archaeon]|nr:hypothetical protein [Nanoarchaeota archaeon]
MKIIDKLLLKPTDFKPSFIDWEIKGILNPGAIRLADKRVLLYVRVAESVQGKKGGMTCPIMSSEKEYKFDYEEISKEDIVRMGRWGEMYLKDGLCRLPTISHFKKVILAKNGFNIERLNDKPVFTGVPGDGDYGVEDARIVKNGGNYLMTYVSVSYNDGVSTSLAVSKDLVKWERKGIIFREQNKDAVIFPEKIMGKYVALHRPEGSFEFSRPSIWISYSPDLIYWGRERSIVQPRTNGWDHDRIGAGAPPIKTKNGWLEIYHGVIKKNDITYYNVGALLLDLKNPEKILARSPLNKPLISPTKTYEKTGYMNNVIFPTGAIMDLNGKDIILYCGGADSVISAKKLSIADIFKSLEYY